MRPERRLHRTSPQELNLTTTEPQPDPADPRRDASIKIQSRAVELEARPGFVKYSGPAQLPPGLVILTGFGAATAALVVTGVVTFVTRSAALAGLGFFTVLAVLGSTVWFWFGARQQRRAGRAPASPPQKGTVYKVPDGRTRRRRRRVKR
jgi:hypothetical protein